MERTTSLMVGIVVAREPTGHPWQEFRWRPLHLVIGQPNLEPGAILSETGVQTQYFAGVFEIELHRKETPAYIVNLENPPPSAYVVLRERDDDEPGPTTAEGLALPMIVETVTVSPFQAQDFLDSGEHIVEPLPMPQPLVAWLENFIATHHEEEIFIKRQRDKLDLENEKFGQEPLEVIRQRKKRH